MNSKIKVIIFATIVFVVFLLGLSASRLYAIHKTHNLVGLQDDYLYFSMDFPNLKKSKERRKGKGNP